MLISSEYVTLGHPDRMCDSIAANLINRIKHNDKENSHAAIEVFASDDTIIFGGEAKTTLKLNKKFLRKEKEWEKKDQRALKVNFTLAGCFCFPIRSMTQLSCSHLCEPHTVERGALR